MVNLPYVCLSRGVRPVLLKDVQAEAFDLTLKSYLETSPLQTEIETAYACKE